MECLISSMCHQDIPRSLLVPPWDCILHITKLSQQFGKANFGVPPILEGKSHQTCMETLPPSAMHLGGAIHGSSVEAISLSSPSGRDCNPRVWANYRELRGSIRTRDLRRLRSHRNLQMFMRISEAMLRTQSLARIPKSCLDLVQN